MKQGGENGLAARIMRWSARAMPASRTDWVQAMRREFQAVDENSRMGFAIGCLSTSLASFARSRKGLHWIGRAVLAVGLMATGGIGIVIANTIITAPLAATLITAACLVYIAAGGAALWSVRALRNLAAFGLVAAGLGWLAGVVTSGVAARFIAALNIEFGLIMAALLFAAIYLSLLYSPNSGGAGGATSTRGA